MLIINKHKIAALKSTGTCDRTNDRHSKLCNRHRSSLLLTTSHQRGKSSYNKASRNRCSHITAIDSLWSVRINSIQINNLCSIVPQHFGKCLVLLDHFIQIRLLFISPIPGSVRCNDCSYFIIPKFLFNTFHFHSRFMKQYHTKLSDFTVYSPCLSPVFH